MNQKITFDELIQSIRDALGKQKSTFDSKQKAKRSPVRTILITLLVAAIYYFMELPALNIKAGSFYTFLIVIAVVFLISNLIFGGFSFKKLSTPLIGIILFCIVFPAVLTFIAGPIFHAKTYSKLIPVEEGVFEKDVEKISFDQIPIVDRETAAIIGSKQMGVMAELVSQFEIDENYAQINIDGKPVRVSPLRYSGIIKYLQNYKNGIPNYVRVDMTKQEASVDSLDKNIMYSASDYLLREIHRHIRFQYPFDMLADTNFELDDKNHPYYVTPVLEKRILLFGGLDVKAVIVTDAHTGESNRYKVDEVPDWVDRVYPAEIIISQLDSRGLYSGGFFNSILGQKNVTQTTSGYNYLSIGHDIFLTTGVTSVKSDDSNLGFYFVNLRTKEAKFYSVPSATESAAMVSAQGKVQEKGYDATFPVVLNINDKPIYFMALKDRARTAKMFAIIDAEQYTDAYIGSSVREVLSNYLSATSTTNTLSDSSLTQTIKIASIDQAVIDGNTYLFIKAEGKDVIYSASLKTLGPSILYLSVGDSIEIMGNESEELFTILTIK